MYPLKFYFLGSVSEGTSILAITLTIALFSQLLRIEEELGSVRYAGEKFRQPL